MMKVSKEEIVGMVTAVESWVNCRNREAEYKEWESWRAHIASRLKAVDGVHPRAACRAAVRSHSLSSLDPATSAHRR
jgi:seryl-tRNA(Sec) selenium transferase